MASFRKSKAFAADVGAVATWLRVGEIQAAEVDSAPFDAKGFRAALQRIRGMTEDPAFEPKLVDLCAANGVAVVFVPEIPGTRASGAARWLRPGKGLIQLSLRHKSDDHFWFSFFHEAAHLLLHSKKETFVTGNVEEDEDLEREANDFAASLLIHKKFDRELRALRTPAEIEAFAKGIGIAPGIVVGRLQNERLLDWRTHANRLKQRIEFIED